MNGWQFILQIETPRRTECLQVDGISVIDPGHIAIVTEEPTQAAAAGRLYDAVRQDLQRLGQTSYRESSCSGPRLLSCMARQHPSCRSVLAVLTGAHPLSARLAQTMSAWTSGRASISSVLPIVPAGRDPASILGGTVGQLNVLFDPGRAEALAPDLLAAAGVGGPDRRLFISYRRADASALADQLFDAFGRAGFKVYLDRVSGTPGRPFPQELAAEITDKGLVLLLETAGLGHSPWTLAEAAFAYLFRIGLLAVNVGGTAPALRLIAARDRRHLPVSQPTQTATPADVDALVAWVRQRFVVQVLRRRAYLESLLRLSASRDGLSVNRAGNGGFVVTGPKGEYAVHLSSRLPRLGDGRIAATARPTAAHRLIVGPHGLHNPADLRDLVWLATQARTGLYSEGLTTWLTQQMRGGAAL